MNEVERLRIVREFLAEAPDDWIGLWQIAAAVEETGVSSPNAIRSESLKVVRELMAQGRVEVGFPNRDRSFTSWGLPEDQALTRIDLEWRQLGRSPTIGEIAWLNFEP